MPRQNEGNNRCNSEYLATGYTCKSKHGTGTQKINPMDPSALCLGSSKKTMPYKHNGRCTQTCKPKNSRNKQATQRVNKTSKHEPQQTMNGGRTESQQKFVL
eukprot:6490601-Karenia_brevis.AAC.1